MDKDELVARSLDFFGDSAPQSNTSKTTRTGLGKRKHKELGSEVESDSAVESDSEVDSELEYAALEQESEDSVEVGADGPSLEEEKEGVALKLFGGHTPTYVREQSGAKKKKKRKLSKETKELLRRQDVNPPPSPCSLH